MVASQKKKYTIASRVGVIGQPEVVLSILFLVLFHGIGWNKRIEIVLIPHRGQPRRDRVWIGLEEL